MARVRRTEIDGKIQCITCKEWKEYDKFHIRPESNRPYSKCKKCHNFYSALRQKCNPPDKEKRKTWARKNYQSKWYQKDVYAARQCAKEINIESTLTPEEWKEICESCGFICILCGEKLTTISNKVNTLTLEHILPLTRGGKNTADNVAPACFVCNSAKRDMTFAEFKAKANKWVQYEP